MSDSSSSEEDDIPPSKRMKPSGPTSFVTWNSNGLVSRCTRNKDLIVDMLTETRGPDVLCMQEVRLKATSPTNRGTPLPADYKTIKPVIETTVFANYDRYWSLADTKYSGTLTLLHKRLRFPNEDAAFCTEAALSLLLFRYALTREDAGLPSKPKGESNAPKKKKQATMTSFFAPKSSPQKNEKANLTSKEHQKEGRFQFFFFQGFDLINTYAPNNGTREEKYQRRRDWDSDMKTFFAHRKLILKKAGDTDRPLLWLGDINVAKDYRDGTNWERVGENNNKPSNSDEPSTYEWFKDEALCFARGQSKQLDPNRSPADRGIPGFTTNERLRFAEILKEGDLVDVWRVLHPDGITQENSNRKFKSRWEFPNWTWRGHLTKDGQAWQSRYEGKGQRLDYFLLSSSSLTESPTEVVEECEILGYGDRREGFCGSDHCPTILRLKTPL